NELRMTTGPNAGRVPRLTYRFSSSALPRARRDLRGCAPRPCTFGALSGAPNTFYASGPRRSLGCTPRWPPPVRPTAWADFRLPRAVARRAASDFRGKRVHDEGPGPCGEDGDAPVRKLR